MNAELFIGKCQHGVQTRWRLRLPEVLDEEYQKQQYLLVCWNGEVLAGCSNMDTLMHSHHPENSLWL